MDGIADDWPMDNQTRVFGEMKVGTRYLSRPDLLAGVARGGREGGHRAVDIRRGLSVYLVRCPQDAISDDRNTEWPVQPGAAEGAGEGRWWGSDGLQIELAAMENAKRQTPNAKPGGEDPYERVVKIGFKPAGVVPVRTGQVVRDGKGGVGLTWKDGPPSLLLPGGSTPSIKYGITIQRHGRPSDRLHAGGGDSAGVAGRGGRAGSRLQGAGVAGERASASGGGPVSSSWSGPVVDDDDVGMMGALVGE